MIVDNDAVTRALLRQIFSQAQDVEVVEAEDGLDAWNQLDAGVAADLCLLEITMPRMDGIQLLRRLRQDDRFKRLKVIFCSLVRDRASIKTAVSLDVEGYILKPFTQETVRRVFERATQCAPPTKDQPAPEGLKEVTPNEPLIDGCLAFLETAERDLAKLRQWLNVNDRLGAWELAGALLARARKLDLYGFSQTMVSLELAVMAGNIPGALNAVEAAERALQSMLSRMIGKPELFDSNDSGTESLSA